MNEFLNNLVEQYNTLQLEYLRINKQRLRYINKLRDNKQKIAYYKKRYFTIYRNNFKDIMENENVEIVNIINNIVSKIKQINMEKNDIQNDINIYVQKNTQCRFI